MSPCLKHTLTAAAALALMAGAPAHAQTLPYGSAADDAADEEGDDGGRAARSGKKIEFTPYIEAGQVVLAEFSPGSDVMTYSVVAAGLDAEIRGRNNAGAVSVRYERAFGWGKANDSDSISGVARFSAAVVPQALTIEAGGLAARTQIEGNGASVLQPLNARDSATQVYAAYAGPSLRTRSGDVEFEGHYRIGYARVESPDGVVVAPGATPVDVFDEAVVHNAAVHVGSRAGELLPVGVGVGAGYNREDVSNLDQRVEDFHVRGDVAVPLGPDLQLIGGAGWEKVKVSNRDALRDTVTGLPVVGSDGRLVTDSSSPRVISFDTEGLIWDAGVVWRPSRRTALEAHVGRRYGSTTVYGSFAWKPDRVSSFNVSAYDGVTSFGGQVTSALAALPTSFQAARNPITGELSGCVVSQESGSCLSGALGSVRSSVFRSRGVMATYGREMGRLQAGFGVGYDRRKFIGAPGTILELANGTIDENVWLAAYLNGEIDRNSGFTTNFYSTWFQSGDASSGDLSAIGANAAYRRNLTSRLSATAALGVSGLSRDELEDFWSGSASLGVRYSF